MRGRTQIAIRTAGVAVTLAALHACFNIPEFPNQRDVKELRVLAIKADPPLVAPGGAATFTALVVDPDGPVDGAAYRWWWCGKTGGGEGSAGCAWDDEGSTRIGASPRVAHTAPVDVLDGKGIFVERYGFRDVVNLAVTHGGEEARAFKRLQVQRGAGNKNPVIEGLIVEGGDARGDALAVRPGEKRALSPAVGPGSRETFTVVNFAGGTETLVEELEFSWYATGGALSDAVTVEGKQSATHWKAPAKPPAGGAPLWIFCIVYDGRGGTDWWAQKIVVEE